MPTDSIGLGWSNSKKDETANSCIETWESYNGDVYELPPSQYSYRIWGSECLKFISAELAIYPFWFFIPNYLVCSGSFTGVEVIGAYCPTVCILGGGGVTDCFCL